MRYAKSKYKNRRLVWDGMEFASQKECMRYRELSLLQKAGEISDLRRQVRYELVPSQRNDGKVIERPIFYVADFVYTENGQTIVEDVKGVKTDAYIIKRKLMLYVHGIRIRET